MQGAVVKRWGDLEWPAGVATTLLPDGRLLRVTCPNDDDDCGGGGYGGGIQLIDWNGRVSWNYEMVGIHHDALMLPSGNVVTCVHQNKTAGEVRAWGRADVPPDIDDDSDFMLGDSLIEVEPTGATTGEIVWEWHSIDHLVQDRDASLTGGALFGNIAEHPERLDINVELETGVGTGGFEFNHLNALDYNAELDQIMISFRAQSEIYIIDHSTSSEDAASSAGGRSGRGGDFLFRWGNPENYARGTDDDQQLFLQHNAHWVENDLPLMPSPARGGARTAVRAERKSVLVFNNAKPGGTAVTEIALPMADPSTGQYPLGSNSSSFAPAAPAWEYQTTKEDFYAGHISGSQRMPNDNTLICNGETGEVFEVTQEKEVVWAFNFTGCVDDPGDDSWDCLFRAYRYGYSFDGITAADVRIPVECDNRGAAAASSSGGGGADDDVCAELHEACSAVGSGAKSDCCNGLVCYEETACVHLTGQGIV